MFFFFSSLKLIFNSSKKIEKNCSFPYFSSTMKIANISNHLCAFIVFTGCIATVVVLLTKFKNPGEIVYIDDSFYPTSTSSNGIHNPTTQSNQINSSTDNTSPYWTRDASLKRRRIGDRVVSIGNGKLLIAGGRSDSNIIASDCELYSSSSIGWQTVSVMKYLRVDFTLTSFANNAKVLAAGSAHPLYQQTAEIYDVASNTWTSTSTNMTVGRQLHAAELINNRQILIIGGQTAFGVVLFNVELFTPSTNSFTHANRLNIGRFGFSSTLLRDESTVLVTGGGDPRHIMIQGAELYVSGSWIFTTGVMTQSRAYHATVLLNDGNVLIAGGGNGATVSYSTAEIYDVSTGRFTAVQSMKYRRALFTLTLLPSGKVLATGGVDWSMRTTPITCELYDPISQTWSTTRMLNYGRIAHTSILMNDSVLTVGGGSDRYDGWGTSEKYKL